MIYTLVLVGLGFLAGSLYSLWSAHKDAKAACQAQRMQRIQSACSDAHPWQPPPGHTRGPKGFDRDRRKRAA